MLIMCFDFIPGYLFEVAHRVIASSILYAEIIPKCRN